MGIIDMNNNADGKVPDFGAIFMSNSETKRECFKRGLFGLPSSDIQFVEHIKAGMILFLFEYEKRQLYGVFQASCDGAMNIVPNAFATLGKRFPAQVKFDTIWSCKPLPEKSFRDALRENYFSTKKFNQGLSENQVCKLLCLFSQRKLEPEAPGRLLSSTEDLKSMRYPLDEVGRSVDHGMRIERVQNEQGVTGNMSPVIMHRRQGDSLQYNGEVKYMGLHASDIKQGNAAVDTTGGYGSEFLGLKNGSRFAAYENEDYMDISLRPNIIGGYSKSPSDNIRTHGEGSLSIRDRLMRKSLQETDQRMIFSSDVPGLHNSDVNPSAFYSNPTLEHNSLVQNPLRPTSTIQAQILNNTCASQGGANSKSISLRYDPDVPGLNFSQVSSIGINDGPKTTMERISPSNNFGRNSFSSHPCFSHTELEDTSRWNTVGDFRNSVWYGSSKDYLPCSMIQNSDQLATKSVIYEACDIPSLQSLSAPIPPDIGKSSSLHDPFSSLFHNQQSWLSNDFHSTALPENLGQITLQKNNETLTADHSWENQGHSENGDPLIHEYDIGSYGVSQNNSFGYAKKKSSVFSRLSFMQDINKHHARHEEYDLRTSVDEVMERVRQSHNKWMRKRKPNPKRNKHESLKDKTLENLKDKTQFSSTGMKEGDCFENTLTDQATDLTTETGGNTNKTAEEVCFVDFKRRSKVRKPSDENQIQTSSENLVLAQQKRRKLIRPNFTKSITSDDTGIDLGASQNLQVPSSLGSYNVKDAISQTPSEDIKADAEVCNVISQTPSNSHATGYACSEEVERATDSTLSAFNDKSKCLDSFKADAELQNTIGHTGTEDKNSSHAMGYVCGKGGEKMTNVAPTAFDDDSKFLEDINQTVFASASCKDKSCHIKKGLCEMDCIRSVSMNTQSSPSICQEHHVHKIICAGRDINTDKEMTKDCSSSFTTEIKKGSEYLENSGNEKVRIETSCPMNEGLHVMDSIKPASAGTDSLHSICQEPLTGKIICTDKGNEGLHVMDSIKPASAGSESLHSICQERLTVKIICTDRGSSTEEEMSRDAYDCLQHSINGNASIATSCFKQGLCMTDSKNSMSQDSKSLSSIYQESYVDKVICAGRNLKSEERMSKDGSSSLSTEVKDGSIMAHTSVNNAPFTCDQNMA